MNADNAAASLLELGRRHAIDMAHGRCKAHQRRRDIKLLEAAGHGVLAANGANAQINLSHKRAKNGSRRLAPTLRLGAQALEILLEGKVSVLALKTCGHELRHALHHGNIGTLVLVRRREIRIKAPSHAGAGGGFAENGQLGNHGHARRQLMLAAEGHEHGGSANGGVEALRKTLVGAYVQVGHNGGHALG